MKVFSQLINGNSFCYTKIISSIQKYSPSNIEFVNDAFSADLVLLHVNGRFHHFTALTEELIKRGIKYVVMQYCIRGTKYKRTYKWRHMWEKAEMVWSYYELDKYIEEEGGSWSIPNFYHSPLGADEELFSNKGNEEKKYIIMSSGWDPDQAIKGESFNEILAAAIATDKKIFHLGRTICTDGRVIAERGISDIDLASRYRSCYYVSGLRRTEGFEMPAVEGLFCGIRPILFDRPHYRQWHDKWGIFIPENGPEQVIKNLIEIFQKDFVPISNEEIEEAVSMFSWKSIWPEFWKRLK